MATRRKSKYDPIVKTWGEIKRQVESQGVKDDSLVFAIDIGPNKDVIHVDGDKNGFEISDEGTDKEVINVARTRTPAGGSSARERITLSIDDADDD